MGVFLGNAEKAPPVSVICTESINSSPGFCLYFRHTYFKVCLVMAISAKQTTRILNLWDSNKCTIDATEKYVEKCY